MEFKEADRLPNYELGLWGQTIDRWYSEGMPQDVAYFKWFEGEPYFRLDRRAFAPVSVGMVPPFEIEEIEETERYIVSRNSEGIITKALKEGTARGTRPSMDQYLSFPVADRESFARIKKRYNPDSPIRYPFWWDEMVKYWQERDYPLCLLVNGTAGLYSQLRRWVGTEGISYLFYDDPALVEEMIEFTVEFVLKATRRARRDIKFDYFNFFEDFAGKDGPLISPELFKKLLLPGYKRIIEEFRRDGIEHFWLDSDGDTRVLIPLMIEAGITCHWPLEQAAGMDPVALRKEYGRHLAFCGGIDKRELSKGKEDIERELYAKIPPLLEKGGYIPHLDHTFPPDISYDNFRYYMELKLKLIRGAT
jgi:uroporphyrinogen decarboxylase